MSKREPKLLRLSAAAHELGLHPMTVRRWIKAGRIQVIPVGREVRVPRTVNARVILRRNNFDPPRQHPFPFQQLTLSKVLSHVCSATQQIGVATPPCGRSSPPGHAVVDGWRRDERTRGIPQSLPRSLVSSAKPTTGVQVVRPVAPPMPRLAHSGCQQSRAAPPQATMVRCFPTPGMLRRGD
jgi:excisionase family DNA binding protein